MSLRIGARWGITLGLAAALVAGAEVVSADGPAPAARLVSQKPGKKKGSPRKGTSKSDDAMPKSDGDGAMAKDGAMTKEAGNAPADNAGGLSFSKDIAPIFAANCVGCHSGNGNGKARGKYDMSTYSKIMAGGKRGEDVLPGDPEGSHLVLMVTGEETPKMPQGNQANISDDAKRKITAWVQQGAKLDAGVDPNALLTKYAASAADLRKGEIAQMPADRRDALTRETGLARWKKASKAEPEITAGTNFLLFAQMPKGRPEKVLKAMDAQLLSAGRVLGIPRDKPTGSGEKISLYVFKDRNTFVEFVRSTENQDVEPDEFARVRLNVEAPYVVALDPAGGGEEASPAPARKGGRSKKGSAESNASGSGGSPRTLAGAMTEALVVGLANQAGKPPRWISLGLGAYLAASVEGNTPYYRGLRAEAAENYRVGWVVKVNDVLGGQAPNESIRAVGFALFEWMGANAPAPAVGNFVRAMLEGQERLDDAIKQTLGVDDREAFLKMSGYWVGEHYPAP